MIARLTLAFFIPTVSTDEVYGWLLRYLYIAILIYNKNLSMYYHDICNIQYIHHKNRNPFCDLDMIIRELWKRVEPRVASFVCIVVARLESDCTSLRFSLVFFCLLFVGHQLLFLLILKWGSIKTTGWLNVMCLTIYFSPLHCSSLLIQF